MKKRKLGRKLLSFLLTLAMAVGLVPGMGMTAQAAGEKAYAAYDVTTETNKTKSGNDLTALQVTFNGKKWYIIEDNSSSATSGTVTLLSADTSFGTKTFGDEENYSNKYSTSQVKAYLDSMTGTNGAFADVADAIETVNLTTYKYNSTEVYETVNGVKLYLLSTEEAKSLPENVRKAEFTGGTCSYSEWWLRSPGYDYDMAALVYGADGTGDMAEYVHGGDVIDFGNNVRYDAWGVRPALKLNLESVIFSSETNTFTVGSVASEPENIIISPASGDIAEALAAAEEGKTVGDITINLTEGVTYTISNTIVAPASLTINGNGAIIDAGNLNAPMIALANIENPTQWTELNIAVSGLYVNGLKKQMFYSACKNYFCKTFTVDNCVVEVAADVITFDFTKGSVAESFVISNSTFYAPAATTKSFYSSQAGQKLTEARDDGEQTFKLTNDTFYNLAPTKNFFTHRQNSQRWQIYEAKGNVFVNCGKSGQVIVGLNGGAASTKPTWDIDGNLFNYDGADTSAIETTGDNNEPVKNSIAGVVTFTDAESGNFNGMVKISGGGTLPEKLGDPRFTLSSHAHSFIYSAEGVTITATCSADGCTLLPSSEGGTDHVATLTIVKPTMETYGQTGDGISEAATLTGLEDFNSATGKTVAVTDIRYVGIDGTTYAESATAPTNAGKYTAKITVEGKTAFVNYEIAKVNPTAPTGLTATYGQTLADVTLPDGWTWADSTQSVGSVISPAATFKANFAGNDNYNAASDVDVTVTVSKAANPAIVAGTATVTKGGNTVDLAGNVTLNGATGEVTYAIDGEANGCTLSGSMLTSGDNVGSVTVNVSVAADNNYNGLAATPITVTISDKGTQTITASDVTATYGDTDKSVSGTTTGDGAISYSVKSGDAVTVDENTGALTIVKAGSAVITVTAAETATYAQATKDVNVTVNTKAMTVSAENVNVTVDGQPHGITVNVTDPASAATVKYGTEVGTYNLDASPTQTEAGELTVYYQVTADNYTTYTGSAKVTVSDKSTQTIDASDVTATYGDTDKKVEATTDGNGAISYAVKEGSADYIDVDSTTGALTIKKVGTATVIVTAAETAAYAQATKEVTVTIGKANAVAATVTANNRTYDGTEKPLVTVTGEATGGTMQYALGDANGATQPYITSIPTATNAGTYYVWYKVVGNENHNDTDAANVPVVIAKADPDYTVPTGLTAVYGNTLQDVTLPAGWTWADAAQIVGDAGTNTFKANYVPTDVTNYNSVENVDLTVSVSKGNGAVVVAPEVTVWTSDYVFAEAVNGQEYVIVKKGETPDWSKAVTPDEGFVTFTGLTPATEYSIYTRVKETKNTLASEPMKVDVLTSLNGWETRGEPKTGETITIIPDPENAEGLTWQWYYAEENEEYNVVRNEAIEGEVSSSYTIKETDVGKYLYYVIFKGGKELGDGYDGPVRIAIKPSVTLDGWTYGEAPNTPVVTGNTGNGKVSFTYAIKGSEDPESETVPTLPGTYTVFAYVEESGDYAFGYAEADFTISKGTPVVIEPKESVEGEVTFNKGEGETPETVVESVESSDLTEFAETQKEEGKEVKVELEITPKKEADIVQTSVDGTKQIAEGLFVGLDSEKIVTEYFEIDLTKYVDNKDAGNIHDTGSPIEIALKYDKTKMFDPVVVRTHQGKTVEFSKLNARPAKADYKDATYYVGDGVIYIYSRYFSDYAIIYTTVKTYNVDIITNTGSNISKTVAEGSKAGLPAGLSKSGYTFSGWYSDEACTKEWKEDAAVTADITIYAKWTKDPAPTQVPTTVPTSAPTPVPTSAPVTTPTATPTPTVAPTVTPAPVKDSITAEEAARGAIKLNAGLKVYPKNSDVVVKWGKVENADRYVIYAAYCKKGRKCAKIATLDGDVNSYKFSELNGKPINTKKNIKLYVVAYRKVNGKYKKITSSITAHIVGSGSKKYSNVKGIKVESTKINLSLDDNTAAPSSYTLNPVAVLKDSSKKMLLHTAEFRYASSNSSVATVGKDGTITAKGKGTCYIYVYAQNGYAKKVKVTVK